MGTEKEKQSKTEREGGETTEQTMRTIHLNCWREMLEMGLNVRVNQKNNNFSLSFVVVQPYIYGPLFRFASIPYTLYTIAFH